MTIETSESYRGTCFGFAVQSSLPFAYLRQGGGTPLRITEQCGEAATPPGPLTVRLTGGPERFEARLHSAGDEDRLWIDPVGWFNVDHRGPEIGLPNLPPEPANPKARDQLMAWRESSLWGMPAILCALRRGSYPIHAASVDVGGCGLLLGAPGTFGKTTLAAAFLKAGHRLLSDDMACCDLADEPTVLPGPAVVRLRRDVAAWLDLPGGRLAFETAEKVALTVEESTRGDGRPVALRAIVLLHKSDHGVKLTRASFSDALRDLFALSPKSVLDPPAAFTDAARLAETVPVWYLDRKLEMHGLPRLVDTIINGCLS
jgi:hypothetical protein